MRKVNKKIKQKKEEEIASADGNAEDRQDDESNNGEEVANGKPQKKRNKGKNKHNVDNDAVSSENDSSSKRATKIKKASSTTPANDEDESDEADKDEGVDAEEEYEVEAVIDHKTEKGRSYYLIRWKGWGEDGDTWEPEDTLSCPELIKKFEKKNGDKKPSNKRTKVSPKAKGKTAKGAKKLKPNDGEEDPEKEWEVEKVIDVQYQKNGSRIFRIRWKGYKANRDTWEPEDNLHCDDLIGKFIKKLEDKEVRDAKQLREDPKRTQRYASNNIGGRSRRNHGKNRAVYYDAE